MQAGISYEAKLEIALKMLETIFQEALQKLPESARQDFIIQWNDTIEWIDN